MGSALVLRSRIAVDRLQDVAQQLVGDVVYARRAEGGVAAEGGALQGGQQRQLSLLGGHQDAEMDQLGIVIEDFEERG